MEYDGIDHPLVPGDCYFVEGMVTHAIWAGDESLVLLAIGNKHIPVDSSERLELVPDKA